MISLFLSNHSSSKSITPLSLPINQLLKTSFHSQTAPNLFQFPVPIFQITIKFKDKRNSGPNRQSFTYKRQSLKFASSEETPNNGLTVIYNKKMNGLEQQYPSARNLAPAGNFGVAPLPNPLNLDLVCPACQAPSQTVPIKRPSAVTWGWCFALSLFGCCVAPFFQESCTDVHLVCARCSRTKNVIKASCCYCE